ncbi:MAG: hypothetical protein MJZ03_00930 [archaeon]|nr:hypothetical protein [archaeon]
MGIKIAICETECKNALCTPYKTKIVKVMVNDVEGFENISEVEEFVTLDDAKKIFTDWEAFIKRNRISKETDAIYMVKIKNDDDKIKLTPKMQKKYTGWINVESLSDTEKERVLVASKPENRITEWDRMEFDEVNDICANCQLSWCKGCIGTFGSDNSKLPEIADKKGCPLIASIPKSSEEQKRFSSEEARELKREVNILNAALLEEGKIFVRRYGRALERLDAVADICIRENCGFFFF